MTAWSMEVALQLRRKIGNNGAGFSDADLEHIWEEAEESLPHAVLICFEELAAGAAKFTDYTQNETQDKKSQVFSHIMDRLIPYWKKKVDEAEDDATPQKRTSRIVGTKVQPPRRMERPATDSGDPERRYR